MKYLKSFEKLYFQNKKQKFKIGDHVIAKNLNYVSDLKNYMENTVVQINNIISDGKFIFNYCVKYNDLPIELYKYVDLNGSFSDNLNEDKLRFATPEEIKKYKLDKELNKYNL